MYVNNQVDLNAAKREIQIAVSTNLFECVRATQWPQGAFSMGSILSTTHFPWTREFFIVLSVRPKSTSS